MCGRVSTGSTSRESSAGRGVSTRRQASTSRGVSISREASTSRVVLAGREASTSRVVLAGRGVSTRRQVSAGRGVSAGRPTSTGRTSTSRAAQVVLAGLLAMAIGASGCVAQAPPAPAVLRTTPPPWEAPRDGISYFELAGVPASRLDDRSNQRVVTMTIELDGASVPLVPNIGVDRPRALQAPAHTHDATGTVWLEGTGAREVTLGQFFTIWGVRFDERCLGAACGTLQVTADGRPVQQPGELRLWTTDTVQIRVSSGG